jgi:hypothetical protein
MGVCSDARSLCRDDADCQGEAEQAVDQQCQVCAVEINTDDNSRIEFNAPRDLIGFERCQDAVSAFYAPGWPYGDLCRAPGSEADCSLRGMGEGGEAATRFADLGLSLLGHGKQEEARRFIEYSAEVGQSPRTELAAQVYRSLTGNDEQPVPRFGPPVPPPGTPAELQDRVAEAFRDVMQAIERQQWPGAIQALERIPEAVRRASGPDMQLLTAYVLYENAVTSGRGDWDLTQAAIQQLRGVAADEPYRLAHPEVDYFLARCLVLVGESQEASRLLERYVTARRSSQGSGAGAEVRDGTTDAEGIAPEEVDPDRGAPTTP